jgi:NTP pyrophosphatase (non-canonical NTP hydrolase)
MKNYIEQVMRTLSPSEEALERLQDKRLIDILHGAIGISTEAGELLDAIKKHIFYGKKIDEVNLLEEIGDVFWYCGVLLYNLGYSFEEVQEKNILKLRLRYPNKFTTDKAINRDLIKEREELEK